MQEYGGNGSSKTGDAREGTTDGRDRADTYQPSQQYPLMQQKGYGFSNKEIPDQNMASYCRVATGIYEASTNQQYTNSRYSNQSAPSFSSPPNSPLVGLIFDPSSPNYSGPGMIGDRNNNNDRRWCNSQEPIGTGAKKKIVKSQRNTYSSDLRYHERYKDANTESDCQKKQGKNLTSESSSSLDFFAEGEKMVSELCNIPDSNIKNERNNLKPIQKQNSQEDDKNKSTASSEALLTALDKIMIHDQIPNQIVQLAVEACTDAENIAIAHHNRPCFKNIHSICAKTRSNVQKPDSAVANLHSQGIPWVIKNFIFSFVRILDGWKGVKELLSEKHDTFSRIENKYYSPNIRECFVQWQAVTKEMLTHIYKTFKTLDHGFAMEQKSFTHNYYATNSAAPRHQSQNRFQGIKSQNSTPRPMNASPQSFNADQPPWVQAQTQALPSFNESHWPARSSVTFKKMPVLPQAPHGYYPLNEQGELESFQKTSYKYDPCSVRETKPRQSWTITSMSDFRVLENMCHADQRELYNHLKHKMDAELGKAPGQPIVGSLPCDLLQRREMELKAKMIPLSHVEKSLIPNMTTAAEMRSCFVQKNNSCGDTKDDIDFFAAWGQMVQKEPNEFIAHHAHNIVSPNVVALPNNISGPVQFIEPENDEFNEMSKVYMKPGSYKVPVKPADPIQSQFVSPAPQDTSYETLPVDDVKLKIYPPTITLAPQLKYNLESWPCLMSRRGEDLLGDEPRIAPRHAIPCLGSDSFELLGAITSDRAWEAAKQSAPKLMDFLHEGSKSDAARLYDALGLSGREENQTHVWSTALSFMSKDMHSLWDQEVKRHDSLLTPTQDKSAYTEDLTKSLDSYLKSQEGEEQIHNPVTEAEGTKEATRCLSFDQTGCCVRDDTQKKANTKYRTPSATWYHPKKKKPLAAAIVKKFENIVHNLSQANEAAFIIHDMDIKVAPRFYEVVKYPMCLHDISTKLKNFSYTDNDQVVQDFRRIFNNVRLYLKSFPDPSMKKNVNKSSAEFERLLNDEFQNKCDGKTKTEENSDDQEFNTKKDDEVNRTTETKHDDSNKKVLENPKPIEDKKIMKPSCAISRRRNMKTKALTAS